MRGRRKRKSTSSDGWLVTYSDLMTLLLAFFVLLFSMSSVEEQKYEMLVNSLQNALIGSNGSTIFEQSGEAEDDLINESKDEDIVTPDGDQEDIDPNQSEAEKEELKDIVSDYLGEQGLNSEVSVEIVEEGILLDVKEHVLFELGQSAITSESLTTLSRLTPLFEFFDNEVRVVGHTDTIPTSTNKYASNWELGAARACAIVRYYIRQGQDESRFVCSSYGDTKPIADNETEEGRADNRRVNFLIVATPDEIKKLEEHIKQTPEATK